ncbi:hypothetical protein B0H14DRAFT_416988 [Mycena olivaceomarginata]|nr:hypothetical protein B0H14DRAFT_416988 [Mycena olivaceomarginata]
MSTTAGDKSLKDIAHFHHEARPTAVQERPKSASRWGTSTAIGLNMLATGVLWWFSFLRWTQAGAHFEVWNSKRTKNGIDDLGRKSVGRSRILIRNPHSSHISFSKTSQKNPRLVLPVGCMLRALYVCWLYVCENACMYGWFVAVMMRDMRMKEQKETEPRGGGGIR